MIENDIFYKGIIGESHLIILMIDPTNGKIVECSEAACRYYGYDRNILRNLNINQINIKDKKEVIKDLHTAQINKQSFFEFKHRLADGSIRDVEVYTGPITFDNQVILISVIHDISERKTMEKELIVAYEELNQIFNTTTDLMRVVDENNKIIKINEKYALFFNLTCSEVITMPVCNSCAFKLCKDSICPTERTLLKEKINNHEISTTIGNDIYYFLLTSVPIEDASGKVVGILQSFRDITERKQFIIQLMDNEKKLKDLVAQVKVNEKRYRTLFESSPNPIIIHANGIIHLANKASAKLAKIDDCSKVIGHHLKEYIHKDSISKALYYMQNNLEYDLEEFQMVDSENNIIDVEVVKSTYYENGNSYSQLVLHDITERKKELAKATLMQKQRLQKKFPIDNKVNLQLIYKPLKIVSGDFYFFHKQSEEEVIVLVGDVTGKGISAALNISAMKVLFYEAVRKWNEPLKIMNDLNKELSNIMEEEYIAAICFSMNFKTKQISIVGAGINEFLRKKNGNNYESCIVKGPSLGMVDISMFEEVIYFWDIGDRFVFYTDGFEKISESNWLSILNTLTLEEEKQFIQENYTAISIEDDTTWVGFEFL